MKIKEIVNLKGCYSARDVGEKEIEFNFKEIFNLVWGLGEGIATWTFLILSIVKKDLKIMNCSYYKKKGG